MAKREWATESKVALKHQKVRKERLPCLVRLSYLLYPLQMIHPAL